MKVRMLNIMAGPDGVRHPGEVVDFPAPVAQALIADRSAEAVEPARRSAPAPEAAVVQSDPELAIERPAARRRGRPRKVD